MKIQTVRSKICWEKDKVSAHHHTGSHSQCVIKVQTFSFTLKGFSNDLHELFTKFTAIFKHSPPFLDSKLIGQANMNIKHTTYFNIRSVFNT